MIKQVQEYNFTKPLSNESILRFSDHSELILPKSTTYVGFDYYIHKEIHVYPRVRGKGIGCFNFNISIKSELEEKLKAISLKLN